MKSSLLKVAVLLVSAAASAQDRPAADTANLALATVPARLLTVLGKVSDDGKSVVTDIDSEWAVSNPDALKGYEGYRVRLRCNVDSALGKIRVITAKREGSDLKYAAQSRDSAFRR